MDPPDLYKLARMRVGERTNKDYEGAVKKFLEWCPDDLQGVSGADSVLNCV